MKDSFKFDTFDVKLAVSFAKKIAGLQYTKELETVIKVAFSDKALLPKLSNKEDEIIVLEEYVSKWVIAYLKAFSNRPSVKIGNKSKTHSDTIVKIILQERLPKVSDVLASQIEGGHALMMTIENLVGDLLEEYLSIKLKENGWCCCWGSTIEDVDFCKADGSLIQIKNSDNSENNASSRVRLGTQIEKWSRRKSTKASTYFWDDLNKKVNRKDLNEDDFRNFVKATINKNPNCLYIDGNHSLN
jgi:hypothetical protein